MKRITEKDVLERIDRFNRQTSGLKLRLFVDDTFKWIAIQNIRGGIIATYSYSTYREVLESIALLSDYIAMSKGEGCAYDI